MQQPRESYPTHGACTQGRVNGHQGRPPWSREQRLPPPLAGLAVPPASQPPATAGTDLQGVSLLQDVEEELCLEDSGGLGGVRGQGHETPVLVAGAQVLLEDLREVLQGGGEQRQRAGAVQDEVPCRHGEGRDRR